MRSWLAPHLEARLLVSQASDRPECKDGAWCDDRYTKSVVSVANTLESARRYRCLGSVGKRDRNWLLPASIHSTDRRDHLATRTPWKPLGPSASPLWPAEYSGWHPSWPDARRHSPLPYPAQPSKSRVIVALAVATVLHRKLCCFSNCLMRFCEQFNMPTCAVQLQDLLITPVLLWQGGDHQDPSRERQGGWLHPSRWFLLALRFVRRSAFSCCS